MRYGVVFLAVGLLSGLLLLAVGRADGAAPVPVGEPARPATAPAVAKVKHTYVIVHGAWGGGWAFKEVDNLLSADGHKVYRPTLTGLGERVHLATPDVDLNTHIQDIVNVILFEDLHDIVLVGHSYGGMVITGVADRVPERIKQIIYVDAFLPEDGESLNTARGTGPGGPATAASRPASTRSGATGPATGRGGRGAGGRGLNVVNGFVVGGYDPNKAPPKDVPQPAKTLSQPISLKNPAARNLPAAYIVNIAPGRQLEQAQFYFFYQRAKARSWKMFSLESDHNVQWSHPRELVKFLEEIP